ncbi:hypothetical protein ABZV31_20250 [Streptomyces sp. NPDC005202]|uniref:hypothetical protein n=1 Tax=Streptomyces sp. NPDC005202 TaxID=3157021 RepID=UPI00339FF295
MCGQPNSAHTVFPCNDHPSDKADFTFRITVPNGLRGVAGGLLVRTESLDGDRTAYTYRSRSPMATELVQITVGDYVVKDRQGLHGLPLRDVVPTTRAAALEPALALTRAWSSGWSSGSAPTRSRRTACCRATPTTRTPSTSRAWRPRPSPCSSRSSCSRRRRRSART